MKVAAALVLSALLVPFRVATACSCEEITLDQAIDSADTVFRGFVTSAKIVRDRDGAWLEVGITEVIPYKGNPKFTTLRTSIDSASCGLPIAVPGAYWFFVSKEGQFNACSFTQPVNSAEVQTLDRAILQDLMDYRRAHGVAPFNVE